MKKFFLGNVMVNNLKNITRATLKLCQNDIHTRPHRLKKSFFF